MSSFVWSEDLLIGHERIDSEHRALIALFGQIEDLIESDGDREALHHNLTEFLKLLQAHCSFEEGLLQALPRERFGQLVDRHCRQHAVLIQSARKLADDASGGMAGKANLLNSGQVLNALMKDLIRDDYTLLAAMEGAGWGEALGLHPSNAATGGKGSRATIGMYMGALVVSVLLLMLALLGLTVFETTARVESEIRNSTKAILAGVVNEVTGILLSNKEAMELIAKRPLVYQPSQQKCDPILWNFKEVFPRFANFTTIELDGTALCSAVPQPGGKPVNVFKSEWFQRLISQKKFVVGKPFFGPITGRWVSVLALPVYNQQGDLVRYLGFPLDLVAFVPSISNAPLFPDTVIGIATFDGIIVWRSKDPDAWVGKSLKDRTAFTNFVEKGINETKVRGIDNIERTYYFDRIEESDWVVWVGVPTRAVHSLWLKVLPPAALLGFIGLLVVAGISLLATRRIVNPIRALADTVRALQAGKMEARASLEGPRDVVEVARELNAMLDLREKQTEELMRSNVELERFAHVASHDLQEPVRSVVAFSQLLDRRYGDRLDAEGKEYLGFIVSGAKRMGDLVRDLLNYSRVTGAGRKYAAVDMAGLIRDALANLQALIEQSGTKIEVAEESLPVVQGDKMQLLEVIQNLVTNAIRYRKANVLPVVRISASSNPSHAVFMVSDNGIGIEKQYWEQIFQIFKRLHGSAYPGTGIGLAICKRIVEGHGGRIWVESKPGEGSNFFFSLPLS